MGGGGDVEFPSSAEVSSEYVKHSSSELRLILNFLYDFGLL